MSVGVAWFPDYGHIVAGIFFCEPSTLGGIPNFIKEKYISTILGSASQ